MTNSNDGIMSHDAAIEAVQVWQEELDATGPRLANARVRLEGFERSKEEIAASILIGRFENIAWRKLHKKIRAVELEISLCQLGAAGIEKELQKAKAAAEKLGEPGTQRVGG